MTGRRLAARRAPLPKIGREEASHHLSTEQSLDDLSWLGTPLVTGGLLLAFCPGVERRESPGKG